MHIYIHLKRERISTAFIAWSLCHRQTIIMIFRTRPRSILPRTDWCVSQSMLTLCSFVAHQQSCGQLCRLNITDIQLITRALAQFFFWRRRRSRRRRRRIRVQQRILYSGLTRKTVSEAALSTQEWLCDCSCRCVDSNVFGMEYFSRRSASSGCCWGMPWRTEKDWRLRGLKCARNEIFLVVRVQDFQLIFKV